MSLAKNVVSVGSFSIKDIEVCSVMKYTITLFLVGCHCVRYATEWVHWNHCAGFINSIFTSKSPTCVGARWVSDVMSTNVLTISGAIAVKLLNLVGAPESS
jgi:hypothetical protein